MSIAIGIVIWLAVCLLIARFCGLNRLGDDE